MVQLIRDYENGILTVIGNVKFDDKGDFLVRMDNLQRAIDVLKEKVRETLTDEWIEVSESKDHFIQENELDEEALRCHNEYYEMLEAERRLIEWEKEQGIGQFWGNGKEKGQ